MSPKLIFAEVSCRFENRRGDMVALQDLSLECAATSTTCLVGPNGAGKSTALALAAGLLRPSSGQIRHGADLVSPSAPPSRLGYLPQQSAFPAVLTATEVLEFAAAARAAGPDGLQRALDTSGLQTVMHQAVGTLSSGWIRRLGLAVALMPPVDLIVLDEPFVGLDLETLDGLVDTLAERAREGAVVLVSSHDFEVIDRLAGRVVVLNEGRMAGVEEAGAGGARDLYRRLLAPAVAPTARRDHDAGE